MNPYQKSRIDAVTVHRRGAVVSRLVELPSTAIDGLRVGPLPLSIDDGSVRVSVLSSGSVQATDLRVLLEAPEPDDTLEPARPEDLENAKRETRRLSDALDSVERDRRRMASVPTVARPSAEPGVEPPPSPAESRIALLSLRDTRLREADERHRELSLQLRDAKRTLADLLEREARATSMRRTEPGELRKAIQISLRGGSAEHAATLRIEYRVDAARWAPSYALRLDSTMSQGSVEVRAMVAQRSGEDWRGVDLTLSTASLEGWAELPELPSVRIGRRQARPAKSGWRPPPVGTDDLFSNFDSERDRWKKAAAPKQAKKAKPARRRPAPPGAPAPPSPAPMMPAGGPPPSQGAPVGGGAPVASAPMPMASMPMAAAARSPSRGRMAKKSKGGFGSGAVEALAGALLSEDAEAPMEAGFFAEAAEVEAAPESVDAAMLNYGRLRMPSATASGRGKLVVHTRRQLYIERIEEMRVEVDLGAALRLVERGSNQVHSAALPAGCSPPSVSGFDYVYRASGRLDAPSDGVFHNLALVSSEGDASARFVVVPRESRDAFRFVEMGNPLDTPLLNGPIDVFVGGDFLMTSSLEEVPEGGVLRLGLGVEQRLKVSRNARFSEKSGGLMGGKLDLLHGVEIEIENLLPREADVEVRERLPVIREEEDDIRIETGEVSPPWTEWEPEEQPDLEGGHRWRVNVPPSAKQVLRASYSIRIASKHELVGGNRRES